MKSKENGCQNCPVKMSNIMALIDMHNKYSIKLMDINKQSMLGFSKTY